MEQFLSQAPLGVLLGLLIFPVTAAALLGVYIFVAFNKRRKKSGKALETAQDNIQDEAPPFAEPEPVNLPVDTQETSASEAPQTAPTSQISSSLEDRLNLAVLSKSLDSEETMPETSKTTEPENSNVSPSLSSQPAPATAQAQAVEPVELLRLLRNPQTGQLIVEVAGKRYTKLTDIGDKKIGQYVLQLTAHLLAFTNGVIVTSAGMQTIQAPKVEKAPEPVISSQKLAPTPKAPPEVEAEFLASLRANTPPPPEQKPARRGFLGLGQKSATPEPMHVPSLNLADEINDIVQNRLKYSSMAQNTQIEITSDPGGGIRIQVNNQFYSSPDDVPDPAARDLIKASIKEWEESY